MTISETLNWRYSTKEFDTNKKISTEDFKQIKALLRMSPSSTNVQPWHFVITDTEEGKQRIAKSTEAFHFNTEKILDASHVVVLCAKTNVDETYLQYVLEQEDKDGRYSDPKFKEMMHGGRSFFANMHRDDLKDQNHWLEKQVYLNMGNLLLGAAALGIDTLPMEGIDLSILNKEFALEAKGFTAVAVVALGYRKESDFNSKLPKSRLPEEDIFTIL